LQNRKGRKKGAWGLALRKVFTAITSKTTENALLEYRIKDAQKPSSMSVLRRKTYPLTWKRKANTLR